MLSDKEIKKQARERLSVNGGNCISLMLFLFAVIVFIGLCEVATYLLLKYLNCDWLFDISLFGKNIPITIYWSAQALIIVIVLMAEVNVNRRLFMDICRGDDYVTTRQYINSNSLKYYSRALFSSFIYNILKIFTAVPLALGIYGVYYWGWVCKLNELTSWGLLCFMLSLGFSFVWFGVWVHYCISLVLTPYIMALNPRTNIFDACDLSVRLMDGQHFRYFKFMASFIKYILTLPFFYPFFALFPYFSICYTILMEDILGDYWQDKVPGMIKRWKKYQ